MFCMEQEQALVSWVKNQGKLETSTSRSAVVPVERMPGYCRRGKSQAQQPDSYLVTMQAARMC